MTVIRIDRRDADDLWNLIYTDHLAMLPQDSQDIMHRSILNSSELWTVTADGDVGAFWGLIPPTLLSDTAYLWFSSTKHFPEHVFLFTRYSQRAIELILQSHPNLVGHCVVGQEKSIRWLGWLGAKFGTPQGPLVPFRIEAR